MADRTQYVVSIVLNGRHLKRVIIDPHYKEKHPEMSDELILELVRQLAGEDFKILDRKNEFEFFRVEPAVRNGKCYRLILVTHEDEDFLGVVNAFRVRKKK